MTRPVIQARYKVTVPWEGGADDPVDRRFHAKRVSHIIQAMIWTKYWHLKRPVTTRYGSDTVFEAGWSGATEPVTFKHARFEKLEDEDEQSV